MVWRSNDTYRFCRHKSPIDSLFSTSPNQFLFAISLVGVDRMSVDRIAFKNSSGIDKLFTFGIASSDCH